MTNRTKEERSRIVKEFRRSGESAYRFARAKGISINSLKRWASAEVEGPAFVRLEVAPSTAPTVVVQVGSARVVVAKGFDGALLRAVVEALS
jgi:transposase-like protein